MQKPKGMTRKQYHEMRAIVREQFENVSVIPEFIDARSCYCSNGNSHNIKMITVEPASEDKTYHLYVNIVSYGWLYRTHHYIVKKIVSKRPRIYLEINLENNLKGNFLVGHKFHVIEIVNPGKDYYPDPTVEC